jgi:Protein of unknown function (DUF998)
VRKIVVGVPERWHLTNQIRWLLAGGVIAAPIFAVAVVLQALTRPGFDLTRHPASMLANGDLGWIQITTFLVTGVLMLGCAIGVRRVLRGGRGGTWGPILLAILGAGLVVAGIFRMDPGDGFPVGTPAGTPTSMSGHAIVHNVAGSLAFLSLIVACFVLARRFADAGQRRWATYGRVSGVLFAAGLAWAVTGGRAGSLTLFLGVVIAWTWVAGSAARLARPPTR